MSLAPKLALVTICDNRFSLLLATLLKSIEVNLTSPTKFDLYLVNDGMRASATNKLLRAIDPDIFQLHWLTMDEALPPGVVLPVDLSTFPRNVFVRLFIPYFIPQEITKVVYLDVDMIANQDITDLWSIDLEGKLLGAVVDRAEVAGSSWGGYRNYMELGLDADTKIFNSGLLLIDPVMWRQQNITERVLRCIEENVKFAVFPDQYGLNVVLANQWLELDKRWNSYAQSDEPNPYIIHFTGTKPIYTTYEYNKAYQEEFYRYLRMTPWHKLNPISGRQLFLLKQIQKVGKRWYRFVQKLNPFKGDSDAGTTDRRTTNASQTNVKFL